MAVSDDWGRSGFKPGMAGAPSFSVSAGVRGAGMLRLSETVSREQKAAGPLSSDMLCPCVTVTVTYCAQYVAAAGDLLCPASQDTTQWMPL